MRESSKEVKWGQDKEEYVMEYTDKPIVQAGSDPGTPHEDGPEGWGDCSCGRGEGAGVDDYARGHGHYVEGVERDQDCE